MFAPPVARQKTVATTRARPDCAPAGRQAARQGNQARLRLGGREAAGQPLDAATRRSFERSFGQDFSSVRVHAGAAAQAAAAAQSARAYAAGDDIVFGAGAYQPQTMAGRWLIAHELAHVVQQRGAVRSPATADGALEREAGTAALRATLGYSARIAPASATPPVQYLRVTDGGFGRALEDFTDTWSIEDRAIRLLRSSSAFLDLMKPLDKAYISPFDARGSGLKDISEKFDPAVSAPADKSKYFVGPDGRIAQPASMAGKRPIFFNVSSPSFEPFRSPGNLWNGDLLNLDIKDTPTFIQSIAHEATHAAAFVGGKAPNPTTLADAILAGLQDEIAARTSEGKILGEIGDKGVKAKRAELGSTVQRDVERDVSPAFNLTYLELFFFGWQLREQQQDEALTDQEAFNIRTEVAKNPKVPTVFFRKHMQPGKITSDYAQTWFDHEAAVNEWQNFLKTHAADAPGFATEKEKLVQSHATRFFKGKIAYTK